MAEERVCAVSGKKFIVTDEDLKFYEKMGVPAPTLCPEERMRRKLAWRNERNLFHRLCGGTGKSIISVYDKSVPFPVYEQSYWWSDAWDAIEYGRDFDFSRPFFDQFSELLESVPQMNLIVVNSENADYNMYVDRSKNVYLSNRIAESHDISYTYLAFQSKDSFDSYNIKNSELCYEVVDGVFCYDVAFSQNVYNCSSSRFLFDCRGCSDCFFSAGLRNKQYYFCNEPCTKEEYERKIAPYKSLSYSDFVRIWADFVSLRSQLSVPYMQSSKTELSTGDYLFACKNCIECYDCKNLEDCKFSWGHSDGANSMDTAFFYGGGNSYEVVSTVQANECRFCYGVWNSSSIDYSFQCYAGSSDCFGCVGIKKKRYCILNKQYSKEEYFELKEKIIAHMKQTGEWGEFFPIKLSPFGYNETIVQEYYPLEKEAAEVRGYMWKDEKVASKYDGPVYEIPDSIADVLDDICDAILTCESTGRHYKINKAELKFYRKMNLPIPRLHPDERHRARFELRNPRQLWDRQCDECQKDIQTTYSPERPEKVLCEECYLNVVN